MPRGRTTPKAIQARQREITAVRLRVAGVDWASIAKQCGYQSENGARKAVARADRRFQAVEGNDVNHWRFISIQRLETMLQKVYPFAVGQMATRNETRVNSDTGAVETVKIEEMVPPDLSAVREFRQLTMETARLGGVKEAAPAGATAIAIAQSVSVSVNDQVRMRVVSDMLEKMPEALSEQVRQWIRMDALTAIRQGQGQPRLLTPAEDEVVAE